MNSTLKSSVVFREVIQEDESGSIRATVNAINQKNRRKELAQLPNVRLGMVRFDNEFLNRIVIVLLSRCVISI